MHLQLAQTLSIDRQLVVPRAHARHKQARSQGRFIRKALPPLFLFIVLLAQISIRVRFIEEGYELEKLRLEALNSDSALRQAKMELAMVTRPSALAVNAEKRLGLAPASSLRVRAILEVQ